MDDKPNTSLPEQTAKAAPPQQRSASPLQRILEHGLSFPIVVPAIGGFLMLLVVAASLMPDEGLMVGAIKALAVSGSFWTIGYLIGVIPSLITGLLVFPAWRRLGNGWRLYAPLACLNAILCVIATFLVLGSVAGLPMIGFITIIATLATFFLTRKFRQ